MGDSRRHLAAPTDPPRLPKRSCHAQARPGRARGRDAPSFPAPGAGETISSIARDLGMTPSGVRALLRNRVYLGELRVGKHVNSSPPAARDGGGVAGGPAIADGAARQVEEPVALLAGLVRCASCGHVMSRSVLDRPTTCTPATDTTLQAVAPGRRQSRSPRSTIRRGDRLSGARKAQGDPARRGATSQSAAHAHAGRAGARRIPRRGVRCRSRARPVRPRGA